MKRIVFLIVLALPISKSSALDQRDAEAKMLADGWYAANYICRGSNDKKYVEVACAFRDEILTRHLRQAGMCYGKKSEPYNNSTWHKCGPNSRKD
jgi:hypothetical protein